MTMHAAISNAAPKVPLIEWARMHYSPAPSRYTLRQWHARGQIVPAPELVGQTWYVFADARRVVNGSTT